MRLAGWRRGSKIRRRWTALAAATIVVLGVPTTLPASAGTRAPIPGTSCNLFPADDMWNTPVNHLPKDPHSDAWLASMHASTTNLHPDFGPPNYGMPYAVVDDTHPTYAIHFLYGSESDPGPYPFGPDIPLEGGSDRHALIVNKDTCTLYELYAANWNNGSPKAGSGAIWSLSSSALRPDGWTSADAAGLAILPGLVRWDEVQAGLIAHAIRFTADLTDCSHVWPARHDAGTCNSNYPPMGARFRLKGSFSLSGYSRQAKVILKAMKVYGLVLADNGSDWYFQGTQDANWTNSLMDELKTVPASQFVAVTAAACMVDPDSGQAACP
jgi:hypothetical protein